MEVAMMRATWNVTAARMILFAGLFNCFPGSRNHNLEEVDAHLENEVLLPYCSRDGQSHMHASVQVVELAFPEFRATIGIVSWKMLHLLCICIVL